jgi:hypothetical protein
MPITDEKDGGADVVASNQLGVDEGADANQ